jgi:hypothetical protein
MSPAAKPAKPAPSVEQVVEVVRRDELGVRLAVHVDELREQELDAVLAHVRAHSSPSARRVNGAWPLRATWSERCRRGRLLWLLSLTGTRQRASTYIRAARTGQCPLGHVSCATYGRFVHTYAASHR